MPIISISINEHLKNFINKLVSKNKYQNRSKLIQDALLRLMKIEDLPVEAVESYNLIFEQDKTIVGNMIIILPNDVNSIRKLNKIESEYVNQIISKNTNYYNESISVFIVFEGTLQEFQRAVVDINGIGELKNFRYLIIS